MKVRRYMVKENPDATPALVLGKYLDCGDIVLGVVATAESTPLIYDTPLLVLRFGDGEDITVPGGKNYKNYVVELVDNRANENGVKILTRMEWQFDEDSFYLVTPYYYVVELSQ